MHTSGGRFVTCRACGQKVSSPGLRCPHCGHRLIGERDLRFAQLKLMLDHLAKVAWKTLGSLQLREFVLDPLTLPPCRSPNDLERVLEAILQHAQQVAPGLSAPYFVPRVQIVSLADAGGQFREETAGWVTITVADRFLTNQQAVRAILAHEACHYILESAEIREPDWYQNERLTDLCVFVCGLGKMYLEGYRARAAPIEYGHGHRLGYLTDEEYQFAHSYVLEVRHHNTLGLPGEVEALQQRLAHLLPDARVRDRLLEHARLKHLAKTDVWIYQLVIEQLLRDRRS
jgi:hypothetical protein